MRNCPVCKIIGRNIQNQRLAYRYTQAHLALEAGISQGDVSKVESGRSVRIDVALRIARFLGRSLEELASPEMEVRHPKQKLRKVG